MLALAYIMANGAEGLRQTTEDAVLHASYLRKKLEGWYERPYSTPNMHEVVFSSDLGKEWHPDWRYRQAAHRRWLLPVHGPVPADRARRTDDRADGERIEEETDLFLDAMRPIARECEQDPKLVLEAAHSTRVSRLDEVTEARKPVLRWKPQQQPAPAD